MHKKRVLLRKGLKRNLPQSAPLGELLYCKDTNDLYVGTEHAVKQLTKGDAVYDGGWFGDVTDTETASIADGGVFE